MTAEIDLSLFDRPEILGTIFPLAYSPFPMNADRLTASSDILTYPIEVEDGIKLYCGLWTASKESPTILYFHGNGETVAVHEWISPYYTERGINLFVAEYRGYGSSDGKPTILNMIEDAHVVFKKFRKIITEEGFAGNFFVMGRSLGSIPAVELAFHYQDTINGLIIESGTANNFRRMWDYLASDGGKTILDEESPFLNKVKIRHIRKPTLIIHGEEDDLIPVSEGKELYTNSAAGDKRILIIPGAGHNDILSAEPNLYFDTIEKFVRENG